MKISQIQTSLIYQAVQVKFPPYKETIKSKLRALELHKNFKLYCEFLDA